jgi:hypothetical protein
MPNHARTIVDCLNNHFDIYPAKNPCRMEHFEREAYFEPLLAQLRSIVEEIESEARADTIAEYGTHFDMPPSTNPDWMAETLGWIER